MDYRDLWDRRHELPEPARKSLEDAVAAGVAELTRQAGKFQAGGVVPTPADGDAPPAWLDRGMRPSSRRARQATGGLP